MQEAGRSLEGINPPSTALMNRMDIGFWNVMDESLSEDTVAQCLAVVSCEKEGADGEKSQCADRRR